MINNFRRALGRRQAERAARRALAWAVAGDLDQFDAAVATIREGDPRLQNRVLDLIHSIETATLLSIHHDEYPDRSQLRRLSKEFAQYEEWSQVDEKTAFTCLTALADGRHPVSALPVENALAATFAVGGWLLSAFIPDEVEWTDFLDGILDRIDREARATSA